MKKSENKKIDYEKNARDLKKIAFDAYRAAYRAERGRTGALQTKLIDISDKLIIAIDELLNVLGSENLTSKDISNIARAVKEISEARLIQIGGLCATDVLNYIKHCEKMDMLERGKAAAVDSESGGVVLLPMINGYGNKSGDE